jgi:S-adenosylmethionine synthetase
MRSSMDINVEPSDEPVQASRSFEVVERKGLGHPDSICDAVAETLNRSLARFYRDRFGGIAHYNVDKALLVGGAAAPRFGGGRVETPIEIILCGRATLHHRGVDVPVEALAVEGTRAWFRENFHALDADRDVVVRCLVRHGSSELVDLFRRGRGALANDTSCGVGFAPLSPLERLVLETERGLNAPDRAARHPEIGEDIKVMAMRRGGAIDMTVACAFVDRFVRDRADYDAKKAALAAAVRSRAEASGLAPDRVAVNAADPTAGDAVYVTVTGTSAEAGDDGEVGRGNRANGLITPFRPMTMEAAAGKNPVSHVGKLYNVLANRIAARLVGEVEPVASASVCLVSRIGEPVAEPGFVSLQLIVPGGVVTPRIRDDADAVARDALARIATLSDELIDGTVPVW